MAWLQAINPERALRRFDLINPTAAMVHFPTMAHVLARIPRFGGHTEGEEIYSVAQHSVEGARALQRAGEHEAARAFLLHDGHEYVIGDIATPVAQALAVRAVLETGDLHAAETIERAIKAQKAVLDAVIYEAAGIPWPLPPRVRSLVKEYDVRMGRTERDARMAERPCEWSEWLEGVETVPGIFTGECGTYSTRIAFATLCRSLLPAVRNAPPAYWR